MQSREFIHFLEQLDACSPGGIVAAQAVRDLAWLLFAPDTLDTAHLEIQAYACPPPWLERFSERWRNRLLRLSAEPSALLQTLEHPPRRLGLYAEHLLAWWLQSEPEFKMLMRHQAINENRRTIGDFDFLLQDRQEGRIHIELAVKFFLGVGEARAMDDWVGNSLQDSLGIKWRKATQQQLQLGFHPAAQTLLGAPPDRRWFWFKAWLFYPLGHTAAPQSPLTHDHPRGVWGTRAQVLQRWGAHAPCWSLRLLQRLAPARFEIGPDTEPLERIIDRWQTETDGYPLLVARLERRPSGVWAESERAYLVADDWEARATEWLLSS